MKSVRIGADLERQLRESAALMGVPESRIIREAVAARCREILGTRLDARLRDYVGSMSLGGGHAGATGSQFTALLQERSKPRGGR